MLNSSWTLPWGSNLHCNIYGKALHYWSIFLACVRISGQFKVRLNAVKRCEWYSQSIYVYIIYPSKGLWNMTQEARDDNAHFTTQCIVVGFLIWYIDIEPSWVIPLIVNKMSNVNTRGASIVSSRKIQA